MNISYYGLWRLMSERQLSQKALERECCIHPNTFTKMRNGQPVSMDVIMRLCEYFECDFSDLISRYAPVETLDASRWILERRADALKGAIRDAVREYMENNSLSIRDVHDMTGLAVNTIKSVLREGRVSSMTAMKLNKLGAGYVELSNRHLLEEYRKSREEGESMNCVQRRKVSKPHTVDVSYSEWSNMSYREKEKIEQKADIIRILPHPAKVISRREYMTVLSKVPAGKVTRYNDIIEYFKKKYKAERVEILEDEFVTAPEWANVPWWREISTNGMIQDRPLCGCSYDKQIAKLTSEGHRIVPCGAKNKSRKVENYRNYLFDFGMCDVE